MVLLKKNVLHRILPPPSPASAVLELWHKNDLNTLIKLQWRRISNKEFAIFQLVPSGWKISHKHLHRTIHAVPIKTSLNNRTISFTFFITGKMHGGFSILSLVKNQELRRFSQVQIHPRRTWYLGKVKPFLRTFL